MKARPRVVGGLVPSGQMIGAFGLTEPGAGSDAQGIRTTAVRDGDHYVVNGQKTFITNGQLCDLVIVVARTSPEAGHRGILLFVEGVELEHGVIRVLLGAQREKLGAE